jgi:hypothetical protein
MKCALSPNIRSWGLSSSIIYLLGLQCSQISWGSYLWWMDRGHIRLQENLNLLLVSVPEFSAHCSLSSSKMKRRPKKWKSITQVWPEKYRKKWFQSRSEIIKVISDRSRHDTRSNLMRTRRPTGSRLDMKVLKKFSQVHLASWSSSHQISAFPEDNSSLSWSAQSRACFFLDSLGLSYSNK